MYLVAAQAPKPSPSDFAWTKEGEPVTLAMPCGRTDKCGCERSFTGTDTRKATTVAKVVEGGVDLKPGELTDRAPLVSFLEAVTPEPGALVRVAQDNRQREDGGFSFRTRFYDLDGKLLHEIRVK